MFKKQITFFISSGCYSGYSKIMPGTCGSIVALIPIYLLGKNFPEIQIQIVIAIAISILGLLSCKHALIQLDDAQIQKDPQWIVIDEWAGMFITFIGVDNFNLYNIMLGLILFRVFDMTKIWPIKLLEKLPGAIGIMADDVLAGLFALICFRLINVF